MLKFDETKVKEKLCFNPHTMELVGFVDEAVNDDVMKEEFTRLARQQKENEAADEMGNKNPQPDTAEHFLLFMFVMWDQKHQVTKRAVTRYAVGAKSIGTELLKKNRAHYLCFVYPWLYCKPVM